ncbi:MAG: hypothetical protein DRN27_08160 [Thermoplasmata archaeon]|nr:MAG: hypothetical protein DRN27_08160 [Thermoplasmata archaeon]
MEKKILDVILVFFILFTFLFTSISPSIIGDGNTMLDDDFLEKLAHAAYDEYGSFDSEEYNNPSYNERNDIIQLDEITTSDISPIIGLSDGPLDSPWPMKCHDTHHTGLSPYSTADNPYDELWKFRCDWMNSGIVIDDDGVLYFGSYDRYLYAVYPNGTLKWRYGRTGMWIDSTPAIDEDGTIYVGSWGDNLHAVYPNGTMKWIFPAGASISSSPAIGDDGTIYFGNADRRIFAVNPDGTERWHYDTGADIWGDPAIGNDGTVYIGSWDTYFYALYPNNGTLRWRFKTGHYIKGPPSIAEDETIYFGSWDDYLYALYPNGTMRWRHQVGAGTESNPSIGPDGTIYCGGEYLYAVNPDGTRKWTFDFGSNRHSHQSSPAISADGIIYISLIIGNDQGGEILAVNPNGTERWRKWLADNEGQSSPSIGSDGTVYVGSSTMASGNPHGHVHAFGRGELKADSNGPYNGIVDETIEFTGSATGGYPPYTYFWDFGDEETSNNQNPIHEYDTAGNYTVTLTVTDDNETVAVDTTWALIIEDNNPPSAPIINGETEGHYGESYEYIFESTDPEDQNVWYYIEWDDGSNSGWIGPYNSGQEITVSHIWDEENAYTIKAKSKDIFDEESSWGSLEITMPLNQQYYSFPLLQRLLELLPNVFPILRQLIGY